MADLYDEDFEGGGDGYHRLTNVDEGVEGMTGSATMLALSHVSADTTLQASRISHRSASSPYVLCYECSDDFGVARRSEYFVPRHTSSSSPASRNANRRRSVAPPPSPPAPPNLSAGLSPQHSTSSSHHLQPDGQDGRSSKAVRPRRKWNSFVIDFFFLALFWRQIQIILFFILHSLLYSLFRKVIQLFRMTDYGERVLFLYVSMCCHAKGRHYSVCTPGPYGMTDCSIRRLFKRAISIPYF